MRINILLRPPCMPRACSRQLLTLQQHAQGHVNAAGVIADPTLGQDIHLQPPAGIKRAPLVDMDKPGGRR